MQSLWQATQPEYQPTSRWDAGKIYDVLIVGGGITGLTTGLLLQQQGKSCLLAEAHNIGFGTTGGTTAHLNTVLDTTYSDIEQDFSKDDAKLTANAAKEAMEMIAEIVAAHGIDCDLEYKDGYLFAQNEKEADELQKILEASLRAGVEMEYVNTVPMPTTFMKAARFGGQAQFNIGKYLSGLAKAYEAAGGVLVEDCVVGAVDNGDIHKVATTKGEVQCRHIVYATHIPPGINLLHFRCAPYRSYAAAFTLAEGVYPDALVYDMEDPYHYFRTQEVDGTRYIIAGGFDHKTGHNDNTEATFRELEAYIRQLYQVGEMAYRWSSQYYVPADGLPYIGRLPGYETLYTGTGYNGNGMIFGTLAGKIITDRILGRENAYEQLFSPGRLKPIAGFAEFVKENADVVSQFVGKRFSYQQVEVLAELAPGDAMLADYEGQKIALHKDAQGRVHALDPVCPHAKCIVTWNGAEKTWDCPCHGARFAPDGEMLTGPARRGLTVVDLGKE